MKHKRRWDIWRSFLRKQRWLQSFGRKDCSHFIFAEVIFFERLQFPRRKEEKQKQYFLLGKPLSIVFFSLRSKIEPRKCPKFLFFLAPNNKKLLFAVEITASLSQKRARFFFCAKSRAVILKWKKIPYISM